MSTVKVGMNTPSVGITVIDFFIGCQALVETLVRIKGNNEATWDKTITLVKRYFHDNGFPATERQIQMLVRRYWK